ncbi:MAG: SNF2-related protein [Planctomycetota bacterium]
MSRPMQGAEPPPEPPRESSLPAAAARFEWLQVEEASGPVGQPAPEVQGAEAQEAQRCATCGWLDSVAEAECFRCGTPFPRESAALEVDAVFGPPPADGVTVELTGAATLLEQTGKNAEPQDWLLRHRSAELGLIPGFDELLALGEVNLESFHRYAHQSAVARKALRDMGAAALLADETGLGKTIEAGLVAKELLLRGLAQRVLVVVPASLLAQWKGEMRDKFLLRFRVVKVPSDLEDDPPLVLVSYATIRGKKGVGPLLREREVDLLICDEAHHLKNRGTQQYRAVARVRKKYALLLSATPFHNKLLELKNLLDILKPGLLGSTRAFNRQYVDEKDPRQPRNLHHLRGLLGEVMIRNRRGEVSVKLPPRRAAICHVQLSPGEQAFYDDLTEFVTGEVRERAGEGERGQRFATVLALINLQRALCSSPHAVAQSLARLSGSDLLPLDLGERMGHMATRAQGLERWRKAEAVEEILEQSPGKLVVFCEFLATIRELVARLKAQGISAVPYHGQLSGQEKSKALQRFKDEARVLVASRAGAEGLNIQFCSQVLNFDLPWNPMIVEQRIGRVHRLGQTQTVTVFNLAVKGTIEARVLELLTHKLRLFTAVLGEVDLILGALHSERSFEDLLREAWLKGVSDGRMDEALDRFGEELERARAAYDEIKQSERLLDRLAPSGVEKT